MLRKITILLCLMACDDGKPADTGPVSEADTDTDTDTTPASEEDCTDGIDDDEDGFTDCEDKDCAEACIEDCTDKIDNDQDGLLDCEDDDCICTEEDCYDGLDEDKDGLLDCEDDDCVDICVEDCTDKLDNDQDSLIDCDDDECYGVDGCPGPYSMSASVTLLNFAWAGGSDWDYLWGEGYNVSMYGYAEVAVIGSPSGWKGAPVYCE